MVKVSAWKVGSTRNQEKRKESSLAYCRFRSQNVPLIITGNDHTQTQLITAPIKWTVVQRETTRTHTQSRITRISFFYRYRYMMMVKINPHLHGTYPIQLSPLLAGRRPWAEKPIHAHTWSCTHVRGPQATISRVGKNSPFKRLDPTSLSWVKLPFTRLNPHVHTLRVKIPVRQARTLSLSWDKTPSHWG